MKYLKIPIAEDTTLGEKICVRTSKRANKLTVELDCKCGSVIKMKEKTIQKHIIRGKVPKKKEPVVMTAEREAAEKAEREVAEKAEGETAEKAEGETAEKEVATKKKSKVLALKDFSKVKGFKDFPKGFKV